jgi:hypothetical protein
MHGFIITHQIRLISGQMLGQMHHIIIDTFIVHLTSDFVSLGVS